MIRISDGRKGLYQWDTNRKIDIEEGCDVLHLSNLPKDDESAFVVEIVDNQSTIPDELLQTGKPIFYWCYKGNSESGYTIKHGVLSVTPRSKPNDYVYTPTDQLTLQEIWDRMLEVVDKDSGATFIPSVSEEGIISWTNDKKLPNPKPVNIMGIKGENGEDGVSVIKAELNDQGELVFTLSNSTTYNIGIIKGEKGDKGEDGINGIDGENGKDGIGIVSVEINENQELVIMLSDNTEHNLGVAKGEKGDTGLQGEKGDKGDKGEDGLTPFINILGNWQIGDKDTNVKAKGEDGINGENGKNGEDGRGIASIRINESGELCITYTDTEEINLGKVIGDNGQNGENGISITKTEINANGELIVYYSNDSNQNLGVIVGKDGQDGENGKSAYQYANETGFNGTEQEFSEYLSRITELDNLQKKADLDNNGLVPTSQLPSYVDDVIETNIITDSTEFSSNWLSDLEGNVITPETGKIYVILTEGEFHNKQYRWSGTTYSLCNPSDVNSVNGKTGIVELVPSDIGAEPEGAETRANAYTDEALTPVNQAISNTYTKDEVDTKVKIFHATLDPITTQYIKDSGDFTYADVLSIENCKIEAKFGNVTIILNKEIIRNIEPDPVAGRYVEFSALLRNGLTTVKVFLFVYDPENLPTDTASIEILKDWGDSQYCGIAVQHIVIGDFLDNSVETGKDSVINAPNTKAVYEYTNTQCGVVMNYMQTTFVDNLRNLADLRYIRSVPDIIYDDPKGFEASNNDAGDTWHLTGLDLSPYKRIKCYVCSGGDSDSNYSPQHIVEIHLDDRAKGSFGYFTADHAGHCPNNRNRHHIVTFTVNAEKTAIQFQHSISIYGTAASDSVGGRRCYLIEGYKV